MEEKIREWRKKFRSNKWSLLPKFLAAAAVPLSCTAVVRLVMMMIKCNEADTTLRFLR